MNEHFRYLLDDDSTAFFQKVAREEAATVTAQALAQRAMQKTASATITNVLDRDIGILKTAGSVGMDLGMVRRADAYIDRICLEGRVSEEEWGDVFDKVAGEAINTDIEAARVYLYGRADVEQRPWIDAELAKVALDLIKAAQFEKEAGPFGLLGRIGLRAGARGAAEMTGAGLMGGARMAGRGASAVGRAVGEGATAVGRGAATAGRAVGRAATAPFRGAANLGREGMLKFRVGRAGRASEKLKGIERGIESAKGMKPGAFQAGAMKSLEGQKTRAAGTLAKREGALDRSLEPKRSVPALPGAPAGAKTTAPAAAAAAKTPTPPTPPPMSTGPAPGKAPTPEAAAAKPPPSTPHETPPAEAPKPAAGAAAEAPHPGAAAEGAAGAAAAAKPKMGATFKKMRDQGWKSLTGEEKQSLINAGALGVVGGRLVTGHGIITGGEGLI